MIGASEQLMLFRCFAEYTNSDIFESLKAEKKCNIIIRKLENSQYLFIRENITHLLCLVDPISSLLLYLSVNKFKLHCPQFPVQRFRSQAPQFICSLNLPSNKNADFSALELI